MSTYEEEIQKNLEEGKKPVGDELDIKAYQHVYTALKSDPEFSLPATFADQVIAVVVRKQRKNSFEEYFWFGIGIFLLLIAFVTSILLTDFKISAGIFGGLSSYKGLLIFGACFIGLLHWLDKRLMRSKRTVI